MFNVWKGSTVVFVFQLVLGTAVYAKTQSIAASAAVVTLATCSMAIAVKDGFMQNDLQPLLVSGSLGSLAVFFAAGNFFESLVIGCLIVSVAWSYLIATVGRRDETWFLVFLAALPFGIGMILGGLTLLFLRLYETSEPIA